MKIENIDIQATNEKAQAVIRQDKQMSAGTKSIICEVKKVLFSQITLNSYEIVWDEDQGRTGGEAAHEQFAKTMDELFTNSGHRKKNSPFKPPGDEVVHRPRGVYFGFSGHASIASENPSAAPA
jgi:hypothetical protein